MLSALWTGTVLGAEDVTVKKTKSSLFSQSFHLIKGETTNKLSDSYKIFQIGKSTMKNDTK